MKKLLAIFLTLFCIGCVNAGPVIETENGIEPITINENVEEQLKQLNDDYLKAKLDIVFRCDHDGKWVQRVAERRDSGRTFRGASNDNINSLQSAADDKNSGLTTALALRQTLTVIWIYSNYKSTPEELYSMMFEDCTEEAFAELEYDFAYAKQWILQQVPDTWGTEPGTDFEDPTATDPNDPHSHK